MNKIILFVFAFVFAAALVFAAQPEDVPKGVDKEAKALENESLKVVNETEKVSVANLTYGSCVSDAAKLRSNCTDVSKGALKLCLDGAKDKVAKKKCQADSKKEMNVCKASFKDTKKVECGKIKASFMEKLRNSWK